MRPCIIFLFLLLGNISKANNVFIDTNNSGTIRKSLLLEPQESFCNEFYVQVETDSVIVGNKGRQVKFKRGKAILFTVFTGLFGGHRVYFGTHHRTPIVYSLTFGGLGILPLIDLVNIIFTKDLSKFEHKSQIIMWRE
ncbi:MAG: hypothetical protein COB15_04945 [Flavobacteriales bacterium]|nr:MAG: hypothetical protein COB15_04945 [Flavobacteriales bacterium]